MSHAVVAGILTKQVYGEIFAHVNIAAVLGPLGLAVSLVKLFLGQGDDSVDEGFPSAGVALRGRRFRLFFSGLVRYLLDYALVAVADGNDHLGPR